MQETFNAIQPTTSRDYKKYTIPAVVITTVVILAVILFVLANNSTSQPDDNTLSQNNNAEVETTPEPEVDEVDAEPVVEPEPIEEIEDGQVLASGDVVYEKNGILFLYKDGESTKFVTHPSNRINDFEINPQGNRIAFTLADDCSGCNSWTSDGVQLYIYNVDTKEKNVIHKIATPDYANIGGIKADTSDRIILFGYRDDGSLLFWHKSLYLFSGGRKTKTQGMDVANYDFLKFRHLGAEVNGRYTMEMLTPGEGASTAIFRIAKDGTATYLVPEILELFPDWGGSSLGAYIGGFSHFTLEGNRLSFVYGADKIDGVEYRSYTVNLVTMGIEKSKYLGDYKNLPNADQCSKTFGTVTITCDDLSSVVPTGLTRPYTIIEKGLFTNKSGVIGVVGDNNNRRVALIKFEGKKFTLIDNYKQKSDSWTGNPAVQIVK